jgi:solute:Na+ symporter, SSS family
MFVMMGGMFFAFYITLQLLPSGVGFTEALSLAGDSGKMNILDFSFDPKSRYTVWSGITGGFFLALAYFGTDQSQVQRYLSGKSVKESQLGLIFNGLLKVPMQFFILLCGVMVFVFFQFNQAPIFFNQATLDKLEKTEKAAELQQINSEYNELYLMKQNIVSEYAGSKNTQEPALKSIHTEELKLRERVKQMIAQELPDEETNDKDYVFISFILKYLPHGLIGLLLAVIFSGAMSSTASELNALASTTTIDLYKRNIKQNANDSHYLLMTRVFTIMWGIIAIIFACFGTLFENLIQFVNIVGSIFYGTILGIFLVAFYIKYVKANAVFIAAIITEIIVVMVWRADVLGFLWLNVIGCFGVMILSVIIQTLSGESGTKK